MEVPGVTLLGVPKLDDDHLQLARIIEELSRLREVGASRREAVPYVRQLVEHTRSHFAREEQFMLDDGYALLEAHRDQHRALLEVVESIARDFEANRVEIDESLLSNFWQWVNHHIKSADREYAEYLKTR